MIASKSSNTRIRTRKNFYDFLPQKGIEPLLYTAAHGNSSALNSRELEAA
jgi:hypothetical protein